MVQAATAMGYFLSSSFNSETAAVAFVPIINMPLTLLGGYMINLHSIKGKYPQAIIEWVQYISPVRYCFNGLMRAQWDHYCSNPPHGEVANEAACGKQVGDIVVKKSVIGFYGTDISFFGCCSGLFFLWIFNRVWVVISLTLQDANCACGADQNDTRNQKISKVATKSAVAQAENAWMAWPIVRKESLGTICIRIEKSQLWLSVRKEQDWKQKNHAVAVANMVESLRLMFKSTQ